MLPDRSLLIGQKLLKNAKIQRIKCDILSNFQTMYKGFGIVYVRLLGALELVLSVLMLNGICSDCSANKASIIWYKSRIDNVTKPPL